MDTAAPTPQHGDRSAVRPRPRRSPLRRAAVAATTLAVLATSLLAVGSTAASAAPAPASSRPGPAGLLDAGGPAGLPATVTSTPLPTVQVNGVVWAQAVVGTTVYVTGEFTRARPAGAAPRHGRDAAGQRPGLRRAHRRPAALGPVAERPGPGGRRVPGRPAGLPRRGLHRRGRPGPLPHRRPRRRHRRPGPGLHPRGQRPGALSRCGGHHRLRRGDLLPGGLPAPPAPGGLRRRRRSGDRLGAVGHRGAHRPHQARPGPPGHPPRC